MLNTIAVIGEVENSYIIKETSQCYVKLRVDRVIKDECGNPIIDIFTCRLWKAIYNDVCSIKVLQNKVRIAIKGRIEKESNEVVIVIEQLNIL